MPRRLSRYLTTLGLRWRVHLLTVLGLGTLFAFFWVTAQRAIQESTNQSFEKQLAIANLIAVSLESRLNTMAKVLKQTAAQGDSSREHPGSLPPSRLREIQLQLSTYGRRLFWLNPEGTILWVEPLHASLLDTPFPDLPRIQPSIDRHTAYVSNVCETDAPRSPYVLLSIPLSDQQQRTIGVLVEEIGLDQLDLGPILKRTAPPGSHVEIVDERGIVLASSLPSLYLRKGDYRNQFARLIANQQPLVGTCHQCHAGDRDRGIRQIPEVIAFAPLSLASWGVAVRQPVAQVMAPVHRLRRQILLGGLLAFVLVLLGASWFIRSQITRPIRAISEVSKQFAQGKLDVPVRCQGFDEIARLTAHLEAMRQRLETILEEQQHWNEALEGTIEERTRELSAIYEQLRWEETLRKRLLRKVLTAQEEERKRLARELHDAIGQSLSAIAMTTTALEDHIPPSFDRGHAKLSEVRNIATQALQELRNLIFDLRPEALDDLGLALALHSQVSKYLEPMGVRVRLSTTGLKEQLPPEVEISVFRVVQEAITNIVRHAQATEASISLVKKGKRLVVRIEDDGIGFDLNEVKQHSQEGWGLRGMEERITLLGGKFYISSTPGQGTLVLAEVPLESAYGQDPYPDSR